MGNRNNHPGRNAKRGCSKSRQRRCEDLKLFKCTSKLLVLTDYDNFCVRVSFFVRYENILKPLTWISMTYLKKHPAITYSGIIFIFAIIYYVAWINDSDSFIKNNALNSTPLNDAIKLAYFNDDIKNEDPSSVSREILSEQTLTLTNQFNKLRIENLELERSLSHQEEKLKKIGEELSLAWGGNTNKYVSDKLRDLRKSLIIKNDERNAIISIINETNKNQANIMLADKNLEISKLNLELANLDRDAHIYTLSHAGEFNDPEIVERSKAVNAEIDETRAKLISNEKGIVEVRTKTQSLLHNLKEENLNFFDFVFYSIGISTTTTFGDLLANSRIIRLLVCVQLLLSILVLANVTQNFITKK